MDWNKRFPGLLAPEGEEVDVQKYIDAFNKRNESKNEPVENYIKSDWTFKDDNTPFWLKLYADEIEPSESLEGKNTVGVDMPKHLQCQKGTGVANN